MLIVLPYLYIITYTNKEGVQTRFFSEHKNTKHTFPARKKL